MRVKITKGLYVKSTIFKLNIHYGSMSVKISGIIIVMSSADVVKGVLY